MTARAPRERPWVVVDGEILEVSRHWIRGLRRHKVYGVVQQTYQRLLDFESSDYQSLYAANILNETDQAQDVGVYKALAAGLEACKVRWPLTTRRAIRRVERTQSA